MCERETIDRHYDRRDGVGKEREIDGQRDSKSETKSDIYRVKERMEGFGLSRQGVRG